MYMISCQTVLKPRHRYSFIPIGILVQFVLRLVEFVGFTFVMAPLGVVDELFVEFKPQMLVFHTYNEKDIL